MSGYSFALFTNICVVIIIAILISGAVACFMIGHSIPACWLIFFILIAMNGFHTNKSEDD